MDSIFTHLPRTGLLATELHTSYRAAIFALCSKLQTGGIDRENRVEKYPRRTSRSYVSFENCFIKFDPEIKN
jgi:hypothetical protein